MSILIDSSKLVFLNKFIYEYKLFLTELYILVILDKTNDLFSNIVLKLQQQNYCINILNFDIVIRIFIDINENKFVMHNLVRQKIIRFTLFFYDLL